MSEDYSWAIALGLEAKDSWMREPELVRSEATREVGIIFSAVVLGVEHSVYVELSDREELDIETDITCGLRQMRANARKTADKLLSERSL